MPSYITRGSLPSSAGGVQGIIAGSAPTRRYVAEPMMTGLSSTLPADARSPVIPILPVWGCATVQSIVTTGRVIPSLEHYDQAMLGLIARWGLPGAALAIAKGGRLVLARGYGLAFIEEDRPV